MPIRKFSKKKGVVRGRSLAFIITVSLHVLLLIVAGSYVALNVLQREEPRFEGKQIARPKMKLQKLQVPVKIKQIRQPKFSQSLVEPPKRASMDFKMPAMGGVKGGMGSLGGGGLGSLGFGIRFESLFGGSESLGNELVGTLYDLKQTPSGELTDMTSSKYCEVIRDFTKTWNERMLNRSYYQAPQKKHAISVVMPPMSADAAPQAFEVEGIIEPKRWAILYKGEIKAPKTGLYRFSGMADDVLIVKVGGRIVLDASYFPAWTGKLTNWESDSPDSGKFTINSHGTSIIYGDWFRLSKGSVASIDVLIGEIPGGGLPAICGLNRKANRIEKSLFRRKRAVA